jgi:hypothetical protein
MKPISRAVVCLALGGFAALGQDVVSARSGMIHLVEGRVFAGGQAVEQKFGQFPEVKENQVLRTEEGRAEVILTPGVFLRVGENSSFRMITNRLIDTRLEILSGSAVIEAGEIHKDHSITVVFHEAAVQVVKRGLYRFDAQSAELRVFQGELLVAADGRVIELKDGRRLTLGPEMAVVRFDREETDALDRWSRRRAEYIAMANVSAANDIRRSGMGWTASGWAWNPYFGMFTYVPMSGSYYSPYGFRYWSPAAVYVLYQPRIFAPPRGDAGFAGGGYRTVGQTGGGYSGTVASPGGGGPSGKNGGCCSGGLVPTGARFRA